MDIVVQIGIYAGAAAFVGLAFLVPLFLTQARDVHRLRQWMELVPDLATAETQAAEAALIAEAQSIEVEAPRAPERVPRAPLPAEAERPRPAPEAAPPPATHAGRGATMPARPLSPAERIALDRPATARITGERAALRTPTGSFSRIEQGPSSRGLVAAVAGVLLLGIAVVVVALQLAGGDRPEPRERPAAIDPSEVEVAVLNGTAETGLAGRVGDDVESNGFVLTAATNAETPYEKTVVMHVPGAEDEAQAVATALGVARVEPMDPDTRGLAADAEVAVVAGEDRAG